MIEVDGASHDDTGPEDAARQELLETMGLRVVRFTNEQVLGDLDGVIARIREVVVQALAQGMQTDE